MRALLAQHAPELWVSLASDVCPEIGVGGGSIARINRLGVQRGFQPRARGL